MNSVIRNMGCFIFLPFLGGDPFCIAELSWVLSYWLLGSSVFLWWWFLVYRLDLFSFTVYICLFVCLTAYVFLICISLLCVHMCDEYENVCECALMCACAHNTLLRERTALPYLGKFLFSPVMAMASVKSCMSSLPFNHWKEINPTWRQSSHVLGSILGLDLQQCSCEASANSPGVLWLCYLCSLPSTSTPSSLDMNLSSLS